MPREIDCFDCNGEGDICISCKGDCWEGANKLCEYAGDGGHNCEECNGTGKIKLYTEAEFQEAVLTEREDCALSIDIFVEEQRKIKKESYHPGFDADFEACMTLLTKRAEAIRKRGG